MGAFFYDLNVDPLNYENVDEYWSPSLLFTPKSSNRSVSYTSVKCLYQIFRSIMVAARTQCLYLNHLNAIALR